MAKKTTPSRTKRSAPGKTVKTISRAKAPAKTTKTTKPTAKAKKTTRAGLPTLDVLAQAENDIHNLLEELNNHMTTAVSAATELAIAQRGPREAVVRTMPLDRATATFQRLITEVVDEKLAEMLPPLVALRCELAGRQKNNGDDPDFYQHSTAILDQVLASADVQAFGARVGEQFDPLIHLAVGETDQRDVADEAVSEFLEQGFRTARGKVIAPAKVKVNRR